PCTICTHPEHAEIDRQIVAGTPYRFISSRFGIKVAALSRHKCDHLAPLLAGAAGRAAHLAAAEAHGDAILARQAGQRAAETGRALDLLAPLRQCVERLALLFDACDRWLRDPANLDRYEV